MVDDSAIARKVITESLRPFPDIEVVGTAIDPYNARDRILELRPDVITLDIEMPKMNGLTFLRLIMQHRPMPVIIMSSLTSAGSLKAMEALEAGAVDVMDKPRGAYSAYDDGSRLAAKIRSAACARLRRSPLATPMVPSIARLSDNPKSAVASPRPHAPRRVILIGASTGGPEALNRVISTLPSDAPGVCVAQHIPAYFSKAMSERLNKSSAMEVREAAPGDVVRQGLALVAPGGYHMILRWAAGRYTVDITEGPPVHHQRPAVDVLFDSVTKAGGASQAIAAILTGMGADGAAGMKRLRDGGARTVAQDEESCVVFGMPREAIRLGGVEQVLPLDQIGPALDQLAGLPASNAA